MSRQRGNNKYARRDKKRQNTKHGVRVNGRSMLTLENERETNAKYNQEKKGKKKARKAGRSRKTWS